MAWNLQEERQRSAGQTRMHALVADRHGREVADAIYVVARLRPRSAKKGCSDRMARPAPLEVHKERGPRRWQQKEASGTLTVPNSQESAEQHNGMS